MTRRALTAKEMQFAASRRARIAADVAEAAGDTEAAEQIRDLERTIRALRLTTDQ